MSERRALVLGAGGFIGSHMVSRLVAEGFWVCGVDLKEPDFSDTGAHLFILGDLRDAGFVRALITGNHSEIQQSLGPPSTAKSAWAEIYQFAADMGGAGFVFTGEHDAEIMHNSATINLHVLDALSGLRHGGVPLQPRIFYSSSACIYPTENQQDPNNPLCSEESAYPANPDSEYGWEKLFSERLYFAYMRNHGIDVRIARYHNIFGPEGTWRGGREKAPAAICRKVAEASDGDTIEIWGSGLQTRSFLYIDECIEATRRLMASSVTVPVNIGSEEMVSIRDLVALVSSIAGKTLDVQSVPGPVGVLGRNSDNSLIRARLGWDYSMPLRTGLERTYAWIVSQLQVAQ